MWAKITGFIIRNRIAFLIGILAVTAVMGFYAKDVKLSYDFPQVIPVSDTDYQYYQRFKQQFGEDGDLLIIGFQDKDVFLKDVYNGWQKLGDDFKKLNGVKMVVSAANVITLFKDTSTHRFNIKPLHEGKLSSQQQADSIKQKFLELPFYQGLFFNKNTGATLMAVKLEASTLRSKNRIALIDSIETLTEEFASQHEVKLHYSGLPYIRTVFAKKIQQELNLFLALSVIITSIILLIFFRSIYNVIFPLAIIAVIIVWTMGFIVLLDYKLTMLTGLIPPLIVIIAVPNFIYFLNRYHTEYKKYNNKFVAIIRMVHNIARVIFLNNVTTAIGFGVMYFIDSPIMKEFGVVAFMMITSTYLATLILMPIIFSFLPAPSPKQIRYLNNKFMGGFVNFVDKLVHKRRKLVYASAIIIAIISAIGATRLNAVGYMMDDIPKRDRLITDLEFFESNFNGLMPFEVMIDTKNRNGIMQAGTLAKINRLQDSIEAMPQFSSSTSITDVAKFARQAFYNGSPSRYDLPSTRELAFMRSYLKGIDIKKGGNLNLSLVDSNFQRTRITAKMADVGSVELEKVIQKLDKDAKEIFADDDIDYRFTGFSIIFLKGNGYLITNLIIGLISAIILISLIIALLFPSVRLVLITVIPNLLAILITAGIMGFFNIPLKPSTVLVFSIAFGIAVDASFHFLATYRQDLMLHNWDIPKTITYALNQTGSSIVYTSLVLFFGFGIFCFSTFGSTISLGALTSITILCAMFTNIIIIPALLISFDRKSKKIKI